MKSARGLYCLIQVAKDFINQSMHQCGLWYVKWHEGEREREGEGEREREGEGERERERERERVVVVVVIILCLLGLWGEAVVSCSRN